MLHKAWNSKGEIPYRFPRSSVKFQGHTVQNITDFDPNWAFPDYRPVAAFKSLRFALLGNIHLYVNSLEGSPASRPDAPVGYYLAGTLDGSRPGKFYINLHKLNMW